MEIMQMHIKWDINMLTEILMVLDQDIIVYHVWMMSLIVDVLNVLIIKIVHYFIQIIIHYVIIVVY